MATPSPVCERTLAGFLQDAALADDPAAVGGILADWLEERGDPRHAACRAAASAEALAVACYPPAVWQLPPTAGLTTLELGVPRLPVPPVDAPVLRIQGAPGTTYAVAGLWLSVEGADVAAGLRDLSHERGRWLARWFVLDGRVISGACADRQPTWEGTLDLLAGPLDPAAWTPGVVRLYATVSLRVLASL